MIEAAFLTAAGNISGVEYTAAPEPARIDLLPAVTLYFVGLPQNPDSTTGHYLVTWLWQIGVTVPLNDIAEAQTALQSLLPSVMQIVRTDPTLGATCEWAFIEDREEPPARVLDEKGFRKNLYLRATTVEGP